MFLTRRFYFVVVAIVVILAFGYVWHPLFVIGQWLTWLLAIAVVVDILLLYLKRKGMKAERHCSDRFSNGDDNDIRITLVSDYPFAVTTDTIDEIPFVFQRRDINFHAEIPKRGTKIITYQLRPTERGVYGFGKIRVFVKSPLSLVERRYSFGEGLDVKVYPSYLMLNKYELMAMHNNLTELGIKKIRRAGNNTEFEQIKEYVKGDEYRTINWKASARRHQLMVNVYQDERSQQIFSVIDKGRVMQQAFRGMTLLDYSINASLVLSYVAMHREDKAGLITFADKFDAFLPASKQQGHIQEILECLYSQQTEFGESDFSSLCVNVNRHVGKRSLMMVYTNFSGLTAMYRQLPYLRLLARRHRVLVIFFDDAELNDYAASRPDGTEEYYRRVVARKYIYEKRLIVSTLKQNGILSLLTTPENLSVDVINKYLEMKARNILT